MVDNLRVTGVLAGVLALAMTAGVSTAHAEDEVLTWSSANASVGVCQVGVTCGQPNGVAILAREQSTQADTDFNSAAVGPPDYLHLTNGGYFGNASAWAEAGEGLLGLPQLHAFSESRSVGFGSNPFIGVDAAFVQAVQGYTNTSTSNMLIPLNAFQGLVDYRVTGSLGILSAGIAVTTSAALETASSAALWSAVGTGPAFGQFTAGCGSTGALAIGNPAVANSSPSAALQYLAVSASSCTSETTYLLAPNETFYVWTRLGVVHTANGVTDAANTFNVTIAPEYQQQVAEFAPGLKVASGANLEIPVSAVPEPATWALMVGGFMGTGAMLRRRRISAAEAPVC